ncbi:hypothetical protein [Actinoplanes sp. N902-109]|uniref:hypothetical protein n=1 Tax=Actinoplanes sp. (strain N902-109) TaxID=649831 RepID=UPI0003294F3D|nr:hypothetical protein [Actinoplanes sp. N902-109]AGL17580.1 hypothetical protein L083_4070 [Actinoplanes sp. N902-109]
MRKHMGASLLAGAAALALTLGWPAASGSAAAPAAAVSGSSVPAVTSTPVNWVDAGCATGAFGTAYTDRGHVLVPATITHCAPVWKAKFAFTIVMFRAKSSTATALRSNLRPYAETGPTAVTAALSTPPPVDGSAGLCLLRHDDVRVACVRLGQQDGSVVATPIPVDDPLVTAKVVLVADDVMPNLPGPFCGSCLNIPADGPA